MGASESTQTQSTVRWKEAKEVVVGSELEWQINRANTGDIWSGVGGEEGTFIWRIVKFKVTPWPKGDNGKFHQADSYIVLHSHKIHEKTMSLTHDIHFWIGKDSTADKYGTAAYKTVELYNHLRGIGKQYREAQGKESKLFQSYFDGIEILTGGSESGFKEVEPEKYTHRLLQFKGAKSNIRVKEVKLVRSSLNSGDVFVLDLGLRIIQWNGKSSNNEMRYKARVYIDAVNSNRSGRAVIESYDEKDGSSEPRTFTEILPLESGEVQPAEQGGQSNTVKRFEKRLYRVGNSRSGVSFSKIATGRNFKRKLLQEDYGYVLDTGFHVFFWVGRNASEQIRTAGFKRAKTYVQKSEHPFLPLKRLTHGQSDSEFDDAFSEPRRLSSSTTADKKSCTIL